MFAEALAIAVTLFGPKADASRAETLAKTVTTVVEQDEPLFSCDGETCDRAREKTANLLVVWAFHESSGYVDVVGDNGTSFGLMQMKESHFYSPALASYKATRGKVLKDGVLSIRLGLAWMRYLKGVCGGSVERALNAYASGSCSGTNASRLKVKSRCKEAGGC